MTELEIISDFKTPHQYWAVGSSYGGIRDQTSKFLATGQWLDGWGVSRDDINKPTLDQVQIGDVLAMKSSGTKGPSHSISFTKLKAIGIVQAKTNFYTFTVKWYRSERFPLDFDRIWYAKTIEPLRDDELFRFVKNFILRLKLNKQ